MSGRRQYREACLRVLAERIRSLRLSKGLSQDEVAVLAKLTANFVRRVESADAEPGAIALVGLANGLSVPVSVILEPLPPPPPRTSPSAETPPGLLETAMQSSSAQTPTSMTTTQRRRQPAAHGTAHARRAIKRNRTAVELFFALRSPRDRRRRVNHTALVETFIKTGSYTESAHACGVTPERVRQLVFAAMRYLRKQRLVSHGNAR